MITTIKKNTLEWAKLIKDNSPAPKGADGKETDTIYIKGDPSLLLAPEAARRPRVAVVGTRDIDSYGRQAVCDIITALSKREDKPIIVSGLAFGVDQYAHRFALKTGLPTVAVLPTGLDKIYPLQHENLAADIASTEGCCLVTQFPDKTAPIAINFIWRNHLITHLADAVIVVESKTKGGAMVIARLAQEEDIPVFAVPGRMGDLRSEGCNQLIKEGIAEILYDPKTLTTINL